MKLRRIVANESYVPEIDGLRFVAILGVLVFHVVGEALRRGDHPLVVNAPPLFWRAIFNGDRGVALFFVLSGFVLARPFYQQYRRNGRAITLRAYLLRRVTRLEPPYLLSLVIYIIALRAVFPLTVQFMAPRLLASIFYLNNLLLPHELIFPNFVTWSLEVEVQFYLLAPLLGMVFRVASRRRRRLLLLAMTVAGCVLSLACQHPVSILSYAGYFPAGFLLADLFEDPWTAMPDGPLFDLLGLCGWLLLFLLPPDQAEIRCFLPLLIVPVYYSVFHGRAQRWLLRQPLLTIVGGMCYSIYLMHELAITVSFRLIRHIRAGADAVTFALQVGLMLVATLLLCGIFFVLVERPCMRRRWPQELAAWFRRSRLSGSQLRESQAPTDGA